jgi:hypothetical protein
MGVPEGCIWASPRKTISGADEEEEEEEEASIF